MCFQLSHRNHSQCESLLIKTWIERKTKNLRNALEIIKWNLVNLPMCSIKSYSIILHKSKSDERRNITKTKYPLNTM